MIVQVNLATGKLHINGISNCDVSCNVRQYAAGTRKSSDVVYSMPLHKPYDPQPFPKGSWNIVKVLFRSHDNDFDNYTYGDVKIYTDASQSVNVWALDEENDYLHVTDEKITDYGYMLHYSESHTTLGCIRIASNCDAVSLGRLFDNTLKSGEQIKLEVV